MSKELILEEILPDGSRQLGKLSGTELVIGRDPSQVATGKGLKIDNQAISREHGTFLRIRNHWFYKDLGSTNGSWRNGQHLKPEQLVLVRAGDVLQFADVPVRLFPAQSEYQVGGLGPFPGFNSSTLIVFSAGQFHDEFPLPEYGRALVVGGNQADLRMSDDVNELPRLVIERRGEKVCAYGVSEGPEILLNGTPITETVSLSDGDELVIAQYRILFNDPRVERAATVGAVIGSNQGQPYAAPEGQMGMAQGLREWDTGPRAVGSLMEGEAGHTVPTGRFTFGRSNKQEEDDVEGTMAIDPAEMEAKLAGYDMHPSSRYVGPESGEGAPLHSLEDRLIVLIGFVLLLVLVGLVVWWVFF